MPSNLTLILLPLSACLGGPAVFIMWVLPGGDEREETDGVFLKHLQNSRKVRSSLPSGQSESTGSLDSVEKFIFFPVEHVKSHEYRFQRLWVLLEFCDSKY